MAFHAAMDKTTTCLSTHYTPTDKGEQPEETKCGATLGYFEDEHGVQVQAEIVFVLAVHYRFEEIPSMCRTEADAADIKNLRKTFAENRKCKFQEISDNKERLLALLKNEEELLKIFDSDAPPSVFILFVLSHGKCDGVIFINENNSKKLEECKTSEIFDCLKEVKGFSACQKFVFFGPCRGELEDLPYDKSQNFENRVSCTVTSVPNMHNTVVFYSTLENFQAQKNQTGTSLVRNVCRELNEMQEIQTIAHFLTAIKNNVQDDPQNRGKCKQTPESKIFPQTRKFIFSPLSETIENKTGRKENIEICKTRLDRFYFPWETADGFLFKPRHAAILYSDPKIEDVARLELALKDNLGFNTNVQELNSSSFNRCCDSDLWLHYDCTATFFFTTITESNGEICIVVGNEKKPIGDVIHSFVGPKNDMWIGKPKLFYIVDTTNSTDRLVSHTKMDEKLVEVTSHSGWLLFYLRSSDIQCFIDVFESKKLQRKERMPGPSLQDLLGDVLVGLGKGADSKKLPRGMLVSTLPYLIAFPRRNFLPRLFRVKSKALENTLFPYMEFQKLIDLAVEIDKHPLWLISSPPKSGKSTMLDKISYELQAKRSDYQVFKINHENMFDYLFDEDIDDLQLVKVLTQATATNRNDCNEHKIRSLVEDKKAILVFDGFNQFCTDLEPGVKEKGLKVLKMAFEKNIPVWISTRPEQEQTLIDICNLERLIQVSIFPLMRISKAAMLKLRDPEASEQCINDFLQNFENSASQDVLSNILNLKLIADQGIRDDNFGTAYDEAVRKKIREAICKSEILSDSAVADTVEERIHLLEKFAYDYITNNLNLDDYKNEIEITDLTNTGIVAIVDGQPVFTDQTIAEFLTANHLKKKKDDQDKLKEHIFKQNLFKLRKLMDKDLPQNRCFEKYFQNIFLDNKEKNVAQIVTENLSNVFSLLVKREITFKREEADSKRLYLESSYEILMNALKNSKSITLELLEMGAFENIINHDELSEIVEVLVDKNHLEAFETIFETRSTDIKKIISEKSADYALIAIEEKNYKMLDLLLEKEILEMSDIEIDNESMLHFAVEWSDVNTCKVLLKHGADANYTCGEYGRNCLHKAAAKYGQIEIVKLLLETDKRIPQDGSASAPRKPYADINIEDNRGWNAFHYAAHAKNGDTLQYLHQKCDAALMRKVTKKGETALILAAQNPSDEDLFKRRPRYFPIESCTCLEVCKFLVENGVMVHSVNDEGCNALHQAAATNNAELFEYLLEIKGDLAEKVNIKGETPYDLAGWKIYHSSIMNNKAGPKYYEHIGKIIVGIVDFISPKLLLAFVQKMKAENIQITLAESEKYDLITSCFRNRLNMNDEPHERLDILLQYGILKTTDTTESGETMLCAASKLSGSYNLAKVLRKHGADANQAHEKSE
ncbi:uncharacterized protein LOC132197480 isoform X2 [Neocloeon triangulifer]|uniref:uncharacterized protein LOC132197480 isoform X2 n=1 Tax=Neocloeon triangulifer TaxID=2078957 RepID=UPI00286EF3D9|nr:uncharacterized protein LOC132197480 isoform X2 [Neocloeon triangulifer]